VLTNVGTTTDGVNDVEMVAHDVGGARAANANDIAVCPPTRKVGVAAGLNAGAR